ncbi:hypothetical protein WR25_13770 [Diploscapter pachys]|uniref:Uncharacterized protein n=1 Tax=Diploscapter pachys TaxID=2018661 RepID=A0A2A2KQS5_9BILA|nr:hypothetical protein WR25_13770 [Diploscapter pachys]
MPPITPIPIRWHRPVPRTTTTLTIDVHDISLVACPDETAKVYEKALDLTKDGNDLAAGNVTGSDPQSITETTSGSLAGSVSGGIGVLTFTLDSLGNTTTSTIVVSIVDDVPKAHSDFANVYEGGTVSGNVLVNDVVGADVRADGQYVVGVRAGSDTSTSAIGQLGSNVAGQYGYLTLDAQGNATYHANPNSVAPAGATDVFIYTIRDADGDESTTTLTIDVHDISLVACPDETAKVYEKALDLTKDGNDLAAGNVTGSDPHSTTETTSGSLAGSVSGGIGALTFTLVGNATGHFTYQVKDSLGNTTTSTIVVSIVDDVPKAHCDVASVKEGASVSGNVLDNDVVGADVRADGQYVVGVRAGSDTSTSAIGHVGDTIRAGRRRDRQLRLHHP